MASGPRTVTSDEPDVVVIGAGPAGTAAAIGCARAGYDVAILSADAYPAPRPAASLHPGVASVLRQLGVEHVVSSANFLRHAGHTVAWGSPPSFEPFGGSAAEPWLGFHAPREQLDDLLLRQARDVGVRVLEDCHAIRPVVRHGRVEGVLTSSGALRTRIVVDASGGKHWLARQLCLGVHRASRPLVAFYGHQEAPAAATHAEPRLTADPNGWSWSAPLHDGRRSWVRVPYRATSIDRAALQREFGATHAADITWRIVPMAAGPGYFLAGDAAAVLDPLSSSGVLRALMSGAYAASLVDGIRRRRIDEADAANAYRAWWCDLFDHQVRTLKDLYARLPRSWHVAIEPTDRTR